MKSVLKTVQRDFNRAAKNYDACAGLQLGVLRHLVQMTTPHLALDANVLDAGCGTGRLYSELSTTQNYCGMDIAEGMCHEVSKKTPAVTCAEMRALPFRESYFDVAFSSLVFQWIPSRVEVFSELGSVIKPGGVLALSTFVEGTLSELDEAMYHADGNNHVSLFATIEAMQREAESSGWELIRQEQETQAVRYASFSAMLRSIKSIGAAHKHEARRKGLMSPSVLKNAEDFYVSNFSHPHPGITATWKIGYFLFRKGGDHG